MKHVQRPPTMHASLQKLIECGVKFETVLDVGVLVVTQPLVDVCGDKVHHLFEPVDTHYDTIRRNYKNINHVLHQIALSDADGDMYLACTSINNDGVITHSHLVEKEVSKSESQNLVRCSKIRRARLDTIVAEFDVQPPYLIKIDVDGHELNVLKGAQHTLQETSIVVIEAPLDRGGLPKFFERALYILDSGFDLMDIVDLSYYNGILWQVDLVFVRHDIVELIDRLKPFQADSFSFDGSKWYALNDQKFI